MLRFLRNLLRRTRLHREIEFSSNLSSYEIHRVSDLVLEILQITISVEYSLFSIFQIL